MSINTQALVLWLVLLLTAVITGLVYLAALGSIVALAVLASLVTVLLIVIGYSLSMYQVKTISDSSQQVFRSNAKENLDIMNAMQRVQNQQNRTVMDQLKTAARLPDPGVPNPNGVARDFDFEEADFSELM